MTRPDPQPQSDVLQRPIDRTAVSEHLVRLISDWGAGSTDEMRALIAPRIDALSEARLEEVLERTRSTGNAWGYHPPDPFVRELGRQVLARVLTGGSTVEGAEQLEAARDRPVMLLGNHLSYVDVNVVDALCSHAGYADVMDRMAVVVGPKVYMAPIRLLASLCFGTIKTPQSTSIASGEAVMSPREVALLARQTLDVAHKRAGLGDQLLVFPEGSRSRSGAMHACLPAVARYLEIPGIWLLPFAHVGCERLVPLDEDHVYPQEVHVRFGTPLPAASLLDRTAGNRRCTVDVLGFWIAHLLPEPYRGRYAQPSPQSELEGAFEIAMDLLGPTRSDARA